MAIVDWYVEGVEFELAEIGSASSKTGSDSAIDLDLTASYGAFNQLRHSGSGIVRQ